VLAPATVNVRPVPDVVRQGEDVAMMVAVRVLLSRRKACTPRLNTQAGSAGSLSENKDVWLRAAKLDWCGKKMKTIFFVMVLASSVASARMKEGVSGLPRVGVSEARSIPNYQQCTHKAGRLWLTVTNYGILGNRRDYSFTDCLTGQATSSAEFPGGSRIEYLFQAALWVGATVGNDTLVMVGTDGWVSSGGNLNPPPGSMGEIVKRSTNPNSPYYDPRAHSDQDFIAVMHDTLKDCYFATCFDPSDATPYQPLGLKIILRSYSWATSWGQDWVLLDYQIVNIGGKHLSNVYLGMFVDAEIGHIGTDLAYLDDLSSSILSEANGYAQANLKGDKVICQDTIALAYSYDNDGDPYNGFFNFASPTAATGIGIVRLPRELSQVKTSFNWWAPNTDPALDWGPQKAPGRQNLVGGLGEPLGREMKWRYLSNGEIDYDQAFSAINQHFVDLGFGNGWLPPLPLQSAAVDLANGADTRYLLSFGPFELPPGDSLPFTLVYVAAENFHTDPNNFAENLGANAFNFLDSAKVNAYISGLDTLAASALLTNARLARQVFDNVTDSSLFLCGLLPHPQDAGFFIPVYSRHRHGDGIPDLKGPQPPPFPELKFATGRGEITMRWFGRPTEEAIDGFTGLRDFEGYRIQMSNNGGYYTMVGTFDRVDWKPYFFDLAAKRWLPAPVGPLTYNEIQEIYATQWDTCRNKPGNISRPIDPAKYNAPTGAIHTLPAVDLSRCNPDTTNTAINIHFCDFCSGPPIRGKGVDTAFFLPRGITTRAWTRLECIQKLPTSTTTVPTGISIRFPGFSRLNPFTLRLPPSISGGLGQG